MKWTALLLFVIIVTQTNAQEKRIKLSVIKVGHIDGNYSMAVDMSKSDTAYYIYLGFNNMKYPSLTDIQSVFITTSEDLNKLVQDLDSAINNIDDKEADITWSNEKYSIDKWQGYKALMLYSPRNEGYTSLNKKQASDLVSWLKKIDFGKNN